MNGGERGVENVQERRQGSSIQMDQGWRKANFDEKSAPTAHLCRIESWLALALPRKVVTRNENSSLPVCATACRLVVRLLRHPMEGVQW